MMICAVTVVIPTRKLHAARKKNVGDTALAMSFTAFALIASDASLRGWMTSPSSTKSSRPIACPSCVSVAMRLPCTTVTPNAEAIFGSSGWW